MSSRRPVGSRLVRLVSKPAPVLAPDHDDRYFAKGFASTASYIDRFGGHLDFEGKSVLDVGCGYGTTCVAIAERGAARVVGIDVSERFVRFAGEKLRRDYPHLADKVEFRVVAPTGDPDPERFDLVVSKDSFEHIADPEGYLSAMKGYLKPGGELAIGLSPLWKSPYGAHIKDQTRLPWIHLLLPDGAVLAERRRLGFPDAEGGWDTVAGGLNKMTIGRFESITDDPELEAIHLATNAHGRRLGRLFTVLARVPGIREYFTFNVYGLWRFVPTL
jgi:SAM-dependent methyltransferase